MVRAAICTVALSLLLGATVPAGALPLAGRSGRIAVGAAPPLHYARVRKHAPPAPLRQAAATAPARAYLLRGFMNVFSLGLDDLAAKLRANGIAATVANHADAEAFVAEIVARYQAGDQGPIIIIGHSLGADAAIAMAQALDRYAIPVSLVVLFDGTTPHEVPENVTTAVNFTEQFDLSPAPDFHGTIANVNLQGDLSMDHFTVDKSPALQATALRYALQAASPPPAVPARRR